MTPPISPPRETMSYLTFPVSTRSVPVSTDTVLTDMTYQWLYNSVLFGDDQSDLFGDDQLRHDDVSDTESTDITEKLPVGYQVTNLLETFLWLSVGQDSQIQSVLHVIHIPDFSTPHRLDTYTPSLLRLTGFMGSPSTTDSKIRYWKPTLIPTSDLPLSVNSWVWRWCGADVCVVSCVIHLCHICSPSGRIVVGSLGHLS